MNDASDDQNLLAVLSQKLCRHHRRRGHRRTFGDGELVFVLPIPTKWSEIMTNPTREPFHRARR